MYCKACGKKIASDSTFCSYCGASVVDSISDTSVSSKKQTKKQAVTWEYDEFVHTFRKGETWARLGDPGGYTVTVARQEFWEGCQREIREELQPYLDEGWEPIGEIGPASLEIRTYTGVKFTGFWGVVLVVFTIMTLGLILLLIMGPYAEPTNFRLKIRRPT